MAKKQIILYHIYQSKKILLKSVAPMFSRWGCKFTCVFPYWENTYGNVVNLSMTLSTELNPAVNNNIIMLIDKSKYFK
jgi:hypothetical protein